MPERIEENETDVNPRITSVKIGARKLRNIKIYPLSFADQAEASDLVTEGFKAVIGLSDGGKPDLEFIQFVINTVQNNLSRIIKLITDEEDGEFVLKNITNDQLIGLAEVVYKINYEKLLKNALSLFGRVMENVHAMNEQSLSEGQHQQSVKDTDTDLNTSTTDPSEMEG